MLDSFNDYQKVEQSWRKKDGQWILADTPFEEQWNKNEKQQVIVEIRECIDHGGRAVGAFNGEELVAWICVGKKLFGSSRQYANLDYMYVSYEYRNRGLGKALFQYAKEAAKELGAKKLYISGHSSKATQAFYRSVGCREAEEVDPELYKREPLDCHLEYVL